MCLKVVLKSEVYVYKLQIYTISCLSQLQEQAIYGGSGSNWWSSSKDVDWPEEQIAWKLFQILFFLPLVSQNEMCFG